MIDYENNSIICDGCGCVYVADTAQQAEREAQTNGWYCGLTRDKCPCCLNNNNVPLDEN